MGVSTRPEPFDEGMALVLQAPVLPVLPVTQATCPCQVLVVLAFACTNSKKMDRIDI